MVLYEVIQYTSHLPASLHTPSSTSLVVRYASCYLPRVLGHCSAMQMLQNVAEATQRQLLQDTAKTAETFKCKNPFELEEKKKWDRTRFGRLEHTKLMSLESVPESSVQWPTNHRMTFVSCKNHVLTYRMVNAEKEAERIAEIYQRAIDEMSGNSDYEWHHSPDAIRSHVASGEYSIWGTYDQTDDNKLISVFSARKMLGQRGIHVIWGAVDPDCRGRGVWENFGVFIDSMVEKSGAQYGVCWAATTHSLTQQTLEKVGWRPVGFFHGGEFLGGTDGQFYRQSVVWYTKLFNEADQAVQSPRDLVLTEAAENVAKAVMAYGE